MSITSVRLTVGAARQADRNVRWLHHKIEDTFASDRVLWARPSWSAVIVRSDGLRIGSDISWLECVGMLDDPAPHVGDDIIVQVIACPTRSVRPAGAHCRGTRTPIPVGDDSSAWIRRHLDQAMTIDTVEQRGMPTVWAHKPGTTATIRRIRFAVSGRVTDAGALKRLIDTGIGPGKAYGCGMVVILP